MDVSPPSEWAIVATGLVGLTLLVVSVWMLFH